MDDSLDVNHSNPKKANMTACKQRVSSEIEKINFSFFFEGTSEIKKPSNGINMKKIRYCDIIN
jgi:hypothetical protein